MPDLPDSTNAEAAAAASAPGAAPMDRGRLALAVVCGIILVVMMVLTVVDVIGRYVFSMPLIGATELTEVLLVAVVFIGLPAVGLDRAHVSVDLLTSRFPPAVQPIRLIAVDLVSAGVLVVVAWRLWKHGSQIAGYGAVTNSLRLPVGPVAWFCALCTLAAVAVTLWHAAREARALITRR